MNNLSTRVISNDDRQLLQAVQLDANMKGLRNKLMLSFRSVFPNLGNQYSKLRMDDSISVIIQFIRRISLASIF